MHEREDGGPAPTARRPRELLRPIARSPLEVALLVAAALGAAALGWLNRTPWWGGLLTLTALLCLAALLHGLRRSRALVRVLAGLAGAALVLTTAVIAHPPAGTRPAGGSDPARTPPVATSEGPVQGVVNDERTVEIFAGIPYAAPPVGSLRWSAPTRPAPREQVLHADRFSPVPVQPTSRFTSRALSRIVQAPLEGTLLNPYRTSEDSLSLNIWRSTAPGSEALPVIVYIPGGGFATGSGALPLYDGEALASRGDVITVTLNYRLGVLGFLAHEDLAAESADGASGNYGIQDQIAALEWVQENIASFGGDPDRITVAGESAGGESVCILGASPLTTGLVSGIIGSSGACMGTTGSTSDGDQYDTREAAEQAGELLSERLDGASIEEMREMPLDRLLDASADLDQHWRPSVDGHVLPASPSEIYASGRQLDVPILIGSNADEASLALALPGTPEVEEYRADARETYGDLAEQYLALYPGDTPEQARDSTLQAQTDSVMTRAMLRWARLHSGSATAEAYLYFFTHTPPEKGLERYGAYHGAEVAYAFDNLGADHDADYTEADHRLRDQLSGYWVDFARTGDPNGPSRPNWPTHRSAPEQVMELSGAGGQVAPRPRAAAVDFWLDYEGPIA
ncbi:carboxylesterase/lipase family protein [Brachybacterium atlanticum]|uniref:carboxylesterase/lipase family protein n=1 Tax=Brachybacterium atlanticum TaxID=2911888 RepID=UPI0021DFBBD8|nr:carboxylesterase family protein [Brachybacterium atlanticum]